MPTHLHIDPFSGIAGDMFLGALLDLGLPLDRLEAALAPLPVEQPYRIITEKVYRHGIGAIDLKVHTEPHHHHHHHHDAPTASNQKSAIRNQKFHSHHHHTSAADVLAMVDKLDTTDRGRARARRVVTLLAEAEARVHGKPVDEIHFHEVGAVDSIVDMLGGVVALELLEVDSLSCGPLPISRGYVRCAHGLMPVPAPATAYLLQGLPTVGVDRIGELVTPTGAALVAGLCDRFGPPPPMTVRNTGYGAGDRDDPDIPNLLRVLLGETQEAKSKPQMNADGRG